MTLPLRNAPLWYLGFLWRECPGPSQAPSQVFGHFLGHKKSSTWKCTWKLTPVNAAKPLPVQRDVWLAGASQILHQWLISRGSGKLASSNSACVMYIQRLGMVFGTGSSCRNSVKVPQLNAFTLQRLKNAGIMRLTAKFKNTAITFSQILELGFSLEHIYSKPSQAVTSARLQTALRPQLKFISGISLSLHSTPQKPGLFIIPWA